MITPKLIFIIYFLNKRSLKRVSQELVLPKLDKRNTFFAEVWSKMGVEQNTYAIYR